MTILFHGFNMKCFWFSIRLVNVFKSFIITCKLNVSWEKVTADILAKGDDVFVKMYSSMSLGLMLK